MDANSFSQEVVEALKCYVYRLIDPRNGETFYVGKGQRQRVFAHVDGAIHDSDESVADPKLERIREIRGLGMDVAHIIHRHGMAEAAAKEVEAALIDAYPGLVNRMAGSGKDRSTRHVNEIVQEYGAEEFVLEDSLILISIGQLWKVRGIYGAVRGMWRMRMKRAERYNLVLAHVRGVVRGAYRPTKWLKASAENFPLEGEWPPNKIGFDGVEAGPVAWKRYVGKRVPAIYRPPGAQTSFRYLDPT